MAATTSQVEAGDSGTPVSNQDYRQLIDRIRAAARAVLPPDATVLVVSRGDNDLLNLDGRNAWHFPREADGRYAGHHPADDRAAISHLEDLCGWGAEYLLFPSTAFWWFDHYQEFKRHLETRHRLVFRQNDCAIYALSGRDGADPALSADNKVLAASISDLLKHLLPSGARVAVAMPPDQGVSLVPGGEIWRVPTEGQAEEDSTMASLEELRSGGVQFLVIPRPVFEWLDRTPGLEQRLAEEHIFVTRQEHLCAIYELRAQAAESEAPVTESRSVTAAPSRPGGVRRLLSWLGPRDS